MKCAGKATLQDTVPSAIRSAYYLLRYRDRSEREMRERLQKKGYSEPVVDAVIEKLREAGFLDDRRLAENLRRVASEQKQLGTHGVKAFLQQRGIGRDVIESVPDNTDELVVAERLVEKKLGRMSALDDSTIKKRLWGLLSRRGFSAGTIRAVLASHFQGRFS
jgi:regulatory protein